ncbi:MAG: glucosamine-6-phosphate deaminase [Gemmatales bacterium]|nr:glucosamine-6-phosphate deaminase [Gemmatales bacterium]MDW8223382.1 glucosamine-6-phosphate deaminase [Gemmatales bacterium]
MTPRTLVSAPSRYLRGTRIPTLVFHTSSEASRHVALMIAALIRTNNSASRPTVLGLPTGSTPVGMYRELIRMHQEEGLDFSRVITFNLDEYYPMPASDPHSYHAWMWENFFRHINIRPENVHIPDGTVPLEHVEEYCAEYEEKIRRAGGIDLMVLGIGRTGHIGFNEPGSTRTSRTRLVTLDPVTRRDAASGFFGEENVPHQAITMGVGTILDAKKIVLLAFGEHKAEIVRGAVEDEPSEAVPASHLQKHLDATFILDEAAAAQLTAIREPWRFGPVSWTPELLRRAIIQLSFRANKPLLMLTDDDFREHHLFDLLREQGPAQRIAQQVFDDLMKTIESNPGGPVPTTVLVFSPHPDDDVISMGGTLIHLVAHGHTVHIAYMTSGNIAVFDHDALRFTDFVASFNHYFDIAPERTTQVAQHIRDLLAHKKPGEPDKPEVLRIKALIRETEARAAARSVGIPPEQLHFLDMPFYRTGTIQKKAISAEDVAVVTEILDRLQPSQIYMAGDLSDPHGTHRLCAEAIFRAVRQLRRQGRQFEVWMYRGAWQEWEPHEIDRAVPLSPHELERKKLAIFKHQSQKDRPMFPGSDTREFWQRAEERNRHTAALYDRLGLPQFYALEALRLWRDDEN